MNIFIYVYNKSIYFSHNFEGTIFVLYWTWPEQTGLYHNFDIDGTEKGPKTLSKSTSFNFFLPIN